MKITLGHSPDSDDAFMFYALARNCLQTGEYEFEHILRDIETLNRWALEGRLHCTAVSVHGYAYLAERYAVLPHGASMGDGYGPMVVAQRRLSREELATTTIAIPGEMTSAYLALRLWLGDFRYEVVPFGEIIDRVLDGSFQAGLIIHEGQLTHPQQGLETVIDLGVWWKEETGLPLPLGINVIRRDLGNEHMLRISRLLQESIRYALAHRQDALDYAMEFARGLDRDLADRFVGMYVNDWTLDMGEAGRRSIRLFLEKGCEAGVLREIPRVDFVE